MKSIGFRIIPHWDQQQVRIFPQCIVLENHSVSMGKSTTLPLNNFYIGKTYTCNHIKHPILSRVHEFKEYPMLGLHINRQWHAFESHSVVGLHPIHSNMALTSFPIWDDYGLPQCDHIIFYSAQSGKPKRF